MVRATLKFSKIHKRRYLNKIKVHRISEDQQHQYKSALKSKIDHLSYEPQISDIQIYYNEIEKIITSSVPKHETKNKQNRVSDETKKCIENREKLRKIKNKNAKQRLEYCELRKLTKKKIKEDFKKFNEQKIEEIISQHGSIKKIRKELSLKKDWVVKTTTKGTDTYNRNSILTEATKYFKNLYTNKIPKKEVELSAEENIPEILKVEVQQAIKDLKNHKSPGPDGITNELIKFGEEELLESLKILFNEIILQEQIPSQWTHSQIILLHKKGPKELIKNYRPISLSPCIYKIFTKIILRRINRKMEEYNSVDQAGFRKGFSTNDHLQTLNQVIEKSKEYNFSLYLAFVDFEKAFDSLEHHCILEALKESGVEQKYIRLIRNIYENSTAEIVLEKPGQLFSIRRGVRQGDPLSPVLFTCVLEKIFKDLNWKKRGLKLDGSYLSNLRFADDIILFANTNQELNEMLEEVREKCQQVGLSMNTSKTKVMTNENNLQIELEGEEIESVDQYVYLGQMTSFKERQEIELNRRISLAWTKYWSLREVFKGKFDIKLKKKVFDTCVLPTLTYGCQTWSLSKRQLKRLTTCQRRMERSMLGITIKNRINNSVVRTKTKLVDVAVKVKHLKWKWAGHVMRCQDKRWAKIATLWIPRDRKRRRGRQPKRWKDDIVNCAGKLWTRLTEDRQLWRDMGEAYASQ